MKRLTPAHYVAGAILPGTVTALVDRKEHPVIWWGFGVLPLAWAASGLVLALAGQQTPAAAPNPAALLDLIVKVALKKAVAGDSQRAAFLAQSLGLPLTAKALASESSLPATEIWPGSGQSVLDFVKGEIARRGTAA